MDPRQAEQVADQLIQGARAQRSRKAASTARRVGALQRLYTGAATLTAAGGGFVACQHWFSGTAWAVVCAVACGLVAAVVWSPGKPRA